MAILLAFKFATIGTFHSHMAHLSLPHCVAGPAVPVAQSKDILSFTLCGDITQS
jgi:hypothetical protein